MRKTPLIERFWPKVDRRAEGECWLWLAGKCPKGYGRVRGDDGRMHQAHRISYELLIGPIPDGLELDHLVCDTPSCVNPFHLKPVTHAGNMKRSRPARKTHCKHNHEFTPGNTIIRQGKRHCRLCQNRHSRDYRERQG